MTLFKMRLFVLAKCVSVCVCVYKRGRGVEEGGHAQSTALNDARLLLLLYIGAPNDWRNRVKVPSAGVSWAGGRPVYKPRSFLVGGNSNSRE